MTNPINFLDLQKVNACYQNEIKLACQDVIESGWYVNGQYCEIFESAFAEYCGVKHTVGVGNGLDALSLILKAWLDIGILNEGDEVIVPANTFIATALAVTNNRLKLKLVDVNPNTFNLCIDKLERIITSKSRVIIAVHLYGQLAAMSEICSIASKHNVLVIEDAAQAAGASYENAQAGSFSEAAAFSFYPGKNLGALGDGGMVTTNDSILAKKVRQIANYGSTKKYCHETEGVNSRLDEIQAAILNVKLPYLNRENAQRRKIAHRYIERIKNPLIQLPHATYECSHVWHLFVVKTDFRDTLQNYLKENDVQTLIHYPESINNMKLYQAYSFSDVENTNRLQKQILSLPISPVMSEEEQNRVIQLINDFNISTSDVVCEKESQF